MKKGIDISKGIFTSKKEPYPIMAAKLTDEASKTFLLKYVTQAEEQVSAEDDDEFAYYMSFANRSEEDNVKYLYGIKDCEIKPPAKTGKAAESGENEGGEAVKTGDLSQAAECKNDCGTLSLFRIKQIGGMFAATKVYLDSYLVAAIYVGETKKFRLSYGIHQVMIFIWGYYIKFYINLSPENPEIHINYKQGNDNNPVIVK